MRFARLPWRSEWRGVGSRGPLDSRLTHRVGVVKKASETAAPITSEAHLRARTAGRDTGATLAGQESRPCARVARVRKLCARAG